MMKSFRHSIPMAMREVERVCFPCLIVYLDRNILKTAEDDIIMMTGTEIRIFTGENANSMDFFRNCIPVARMIREIMRLPMCSAWRNFAIPSEFLMLSLTPTMVMTEDKESAMLLIPSESMATDGRKSPMAIFTAARITFEIMLSDAVFTIVSERLQEPL